MSAHVITLSYTLLPSPLSHSIPPKLAGCLTPLKLPVEGHPGFQFSFFVLLVNSSAFATISIPWNALPFDSGTLFVFLLPLWFLFSVSLEGSSFWTWWPSTEESWTLQDSVFYHLSHHSLPPPPRWSPAAAMASFIITNLRLHCRPLLRVSDEHLSTSHMHSN